MPAVVTSLPPEPAMSMDPLGDKAPKGAEQAASVPLLLPLQVQDHGPLPVTPDAVPVLQRPATGRLVTAMPLAPPQVPLVAAASVVPAMAGDWAEVLPPELYAEMVYKYVVEPVRPVSE